MDYILEPIEYLQRGTALLRANEVAVNAIPRKDVQYPHWSIRYVTEAGGHGLEDAGSLCNYGIGEILADPQLKINDEGKHWSNFNFFSKQVADARNRNVYVYLHVGSVVTTFVSARAQTIIMLNSSAQSDIDIPGEDIPRLYNSELMYQAWRDTCIAYQAGDGDSEIKNLKFIIRAPIVNLGTNYMIEVILQALGLSEKEIVQGPRLTFSSSDDNADAFKMLLGTDNGRPVARMCADHAESLGGKKVVKIHVWYEMPENIGASALVFELG
ncbi:hypothetical protein NHQ30_010179 [Ciborinia camelliae]|nr:hypothetical protein NHQ30_010179 [Ciborinia camelliae]